MIDAVSGKSCPECNGRLAADGSDDYVCQRCGEQYGIMEMYMP